MTAYKKNLATSMHFIIRFYDPSFHEVMYEIDYNHDMGVYVMEEGENGEKYNSETLHEILWLFYLRMKYRSEDGSSISFGMYTAEKGITIIDKIYEDDEEQYAEDIRELCNDLVIAKIIE